MTTGGDYWVTGDIGWIGSTCGPATGPNWGRAASGVRGVVLCSSRGGLS